MKKTVNTLLCILVINLSFYTAISQTYSEDNDESSNIELVKNNNMNENIFQALSINNQSNTRNSQITGNSIFLTQIGEFNSASIITETNASEINVSQNGDKNNVDLTYVANTAIADLTQNGDYNIIKDFVIDENEDISLDLIQDGDDLLFLREGVNTLTKSLKFRQSEASPTIIIRSN